MKGFRLFFSVCLGALAFANALAVESDDTARAATRRGDTNMSGGTSKTAGARGVAASQSGPSSKTTAPARAVSTTGRNASVATREAVTQTKTVATRPQPTPTSRTATTTRTRATTTGTSRPTVSGRTATSVVASRARTAATSGRKRTSATNRTARTKSRVATAGTTAVMPGYTNCRTIFYECMDEFCANKDSSLRRCACSSRWNEFDNMKKQMTNFEDKMLDFNQRLLMVNMDAEDVTAANTATIGETTFYSTPDKTKSQAALNDIAKKLNTTFGDEQTGTRLAPISLSLNIDSAFDTVDSFLGSDTTSKTGTALYNAALPVCQEIAAEVCTEDEVSLAVSGYLMQIEQDCNTVYKSYQSQVDQARSKVFESGALLDMSRLDSYQQRNSDDLLTCKSKMVGMLTNSTVCGAKMEKCLDMTGRYIDPSTGTAFLTVNLADLGNLITRPSGNQTWTSANRNGAFLNFLDNKKEFLEDATEKCQDIADTVWAEFLEDALAQIKLAQTAKLEEIRQACTTLTSQCITAASDSLDDFDARSLSIFGVAADRTANSMCSDVRNACVALLSSDGDTSWETGVNDVTTDKTYQTVLASCKQVGQNCIINACKSINGNFDLCDDILYSPNRHSIIEGTACWPEVLRCVADAGATPIMNIMDLLGKTSDGSGTWGVAYDFYTDLYSTSTHIEYDICGTKCESLATNAERAECATCRLAERIWGTCEKRPSAPSPNRINIPFDDQETLLSWFAVNTHTDDNSDSCLNVRCTAENMYQDVYGLDHCLTSDADLDNVTTGDNLYCPADLGDQIIVSETPEEIKNCCRTGQLMTNACCMNTVVSDGTDTKLCLPDNTYRVLATRGTEKLICDGDVTGLPADTSNGFPGGAGFRCNGRFIWVNTTNDNYQAPTGQSYIEKYHYEGGNTSTPTPNGTPNWFMKYVGS